MISTIKKVIDTINTRGIGYILDRLHQKMFPPRISRFDYIKGFFEAHSGLEVGGPSSIFRDKGYIPLYNFIEKLDGCNFASNTIWEGDITAGKKYRYYDNKVGNQFITEAVDLSLIPDASYDFVISSNCLEHIANPLKAIKEWIRVIKDGGAILLILPNKEYCFDHKRNVTEFQHLLSDFKNNVQEDDLTHLEEILELHDLKLDKPAGNKASFEKRCRNNFDNRAMHHHVYDIQLLREIFEYFTIDVLLTTSGKEHIILGKKKREIVS